MTIRGFDLYGGDGADGDPDYEPPFWDGVPGGPAYGSGIYCELASPTIKNCVITNCIARGGIGGDGANGDDDHPDGGHGGWPGQAGGGGLACLYYSDPIVTNCTFNNCNAIGGIGGNGGNGSEDPFGFGGRGGGWYYPDDPNSPYDFAHSGHYTRYTGRGGAIYIDSTSSPEFIHCTLTNNGTEGGYCGISGTTPYYFDRIEEPTINWTIDNFGGAVYVGDYAGGFPDGWGHGEAKFEDFIFTSNTADTNAADGED